ncbi:unnamed protein product [Colias eurytheme]|nr:unnamed protein product [Colias eurytheme]
MVKCAVRFCKNDSRNHTKLKSTITFHQFPKDRNLMKKWITALNQANFEPNIWNKVCSVHFLDSNFYETKKGLRKLISTAVPSLFLVPTTPSDHNSPAAASLNSGKKTVPFVQHQPSTSTLNDNDSEMPSNVEDTSRIRKLKKEIIRLKDVAKRRRMRCNALYATCRRLKKKVENMSQILTKLKQKRSIPQE